MIRNSVIRCVAMALIIMAADAPAILLADAGDTGAKGSNVTLAKAVMCETIEGYEPFNAAVVFSINVGKLSCYTIFEDIGDTTYVTHRWYRRDDLVTTKRLTLKAPRWSTYSSIQLREADKGPWRVEIRDADERLLKTLRFSVTD